MVKIIVLLVAIALAAGQDCTCEESDPAEAANVFTFLREVSDSESEGYPILPALLAPLSPCANCGGSRKKRKIFPEPGNSEAVHPAKSAEEKKDWKEKLEKFHQTGVRNKCPFGYARIGFMCLDVALL
ncbi:unnamed protein product, partial [Iphiclides podalirius]